MALLSKWSGAAIWIAAAGCVASAQVWTPDDVRLGTAAVNYVDPEFLAGAADQYGVTFQDALNNAWVGDLDPNTGLLRSLDGRDYLLDTDLVPIKETYNGPEWGEDRFGPAVFYVKRDTQGVPQIWRAGPPFAQPSITQLTQGTPATTSCLALLHPGADTTLIAAIRGPAWYQAWFDEEQPGEIHALPGTPYGPSRWVNDSKLLGYCRHEAQFVQAALLDTETGQVRVLTNDAGNKFNAFGFFAPEYEGELLLMIELDGQWVAIYRDLGAGDGFWTRIAALRPPDGFPYTKLSSAEPLIGSRSLGQSFFTVLAEAADPNENSIWVLGLGKDPNARFARRVDNGALGGPRLWRYEPENLVGRREAYVYYSTVPSGGAGQLRRCRTGLFVYPGDMNCDERTNFADIDPFVLALADPAEYKRLWPGCDIMQADINLDGRVDFADINPFVDLLSGRR